MSPTNTIEEVNLKFFTKGHTFMSADSFHAKVEKTMRKPGKAKADAGVYNFHDFKNVIKSSGGVAKEMTPSDFIEYPNGKSNSMPSVPLLASICMMQFRKGTTELFWKSSFDDEEFMHTEFLLKKFVGRYTTFPCKQSPRGLEPTKLKDIIKKLCPLMPEAKRKFWEEMTENEDSADLLANYGNKRESKK
jgi:hypothetical protein